MHKLLVACIFGMVLMAAPAWASTFEDLPADHWAYEAVDYLQQSGLVEGYPDGTFHGDRAFTRYEMAMVIARIFTKIQDWQAMDERNGGGGGAPPADIDLSEVYVRLDRLSDEFRDELANLGARVTAVEDEQYRLRGDMDDLKALIKDSGLSGVARWRAGGFLTTGQADLSNDLGYEQYITLNYLFQPEPDIDFKLSMTAIETEGPIGSGIIPGANNESAFTSPGSPPFSNGSNSSSFIIDEANLRYCWVDAPGILGNCPQITFGRQYFSQGEFGMAGDNGYRSNFGLRLDTTVSNNFDFYTGLYRMESVAELAPWSNPDSLSFQSNGMTSEGDDFLLAGLEYHAGEATLPGHDYKTVLRLDLAPNGFGAESYIGASGSMELGMLGRNFLTGVRGEWVYVMSNVSDQDPEADLGLSNNSFIIELDVYNNGQTRVSLAGAQIAQVEGLPALANVDNDPFSEWDFTYNGTADAFNFSREGRNYFPADFTGFGLQAEHSFGNSLHSTFTYYSGSRVNANADSRPDMVRLNLRYPFTNNSSMGIDFIASGEREGLDDPISMIRGEWKLHF